MKKTCFLAPFILTLLLCANAGAQLVTYDFEGDVATPSAVDGDVSASSFARNAGNSMSFSSGNGGGRAISGSGWTGVDSSNNKYWEFTVTANAGITLDLVNLDFDYRSTVTGPTNWELTINGSAAGSGAFQNDSTFRPVSAPLSSFNGLSAATVRIAAFGASTGGGTLRMDNVSLSLTPVPEPSTWLLLVGGSLFLAGRLRRRK